MKRLTSLFAVLLAITVTGVAQAKPLKHYNVNAATKTLPHKPFRTMSLDEVIEFQRDSISFHHHRVATFITFLRHHRWALGRYVQNEEPYCKSLGIVTPEDVCFHASAQKWTKVELAENIRLQKKRDAAREQAAQSIPAFLSDAFDCIHTHEGAWNANTGNGYYGGLQMDIGFQSTYGSDFMRQWGTANNWPVWAQKKAAARAYASGRGFGPWPNTAAMCHLF